MRADEGKGSPTLASRPVFAPGTSLAPQPPPQLLPAFLHVLPAPFADPAVEQAYQAHFDRLKARRLPMVAPATPAMHAPQRLALRPCLAEPLDSLSY